MSKTPPIPPEKRSFSGENPRDRLRSAEPHRRDEDMSWDVANLKTQGESANSRQNAHYQQDR